MKKKLNKNVDEILKELRSLSVTPDSEKMSSRDKEEEANQSSSKKKDRKPNRTNRKNVIESSDSPIASIRERLLSSIKSKKKEMVEEEENDEDGYDSSEIVEEKGKNAVSRKSGVDEKPRNSVLGEKTLKGGMTGATGRPLPKHSKRPALPADLTAENAINVDEIFENMPDSRSQITREIMSYLDKLQYLTLARAEKILTAPGDISVSELVRIAKELKDMQLTIRWTKKLENQILENPSKLTPIGSSKGFSLLSRVKQFAAATSRESEQDPRLSVSKKAKMSNLLNIPLPDDDAKKVGGA